MTNFDILAALEIMQVAASGATLLVIGLIFVIILTIAYSKLKVEKDPTVEAIEAVLPAANCGGCGLAGCGAYAEAVVTDHGLMGKCGPGGEELVHRMAEILGIEASATAPIRAVVHCSASADDRIDAARYIGIDTCGEAQMIAGAMGCTFGCMGKGDCVRVCDFDAVHIVNGLATVDYEKCVGCGACQGACPRDIIAMHPMTEDPLLVIGCMTHDKAKDVRGYCKVGCVGCTLCAKNVPGMFAMDKGLAVIDYDKYGSQEDRDKAQEKCPREMIVYCGKNS